MQWEVELFGMPGLACIADFDLELFGENTRF